MSDEYTMHWTKRALITPGARWVAEQGKAWWLLDACISHLPSKALKGEEFIVFKLEVRPDRTATLTADDGNGNVLATQRLEFTDFEESECELWVVRTPGQKPDAVIMQPCEY